MHDKRITAGVIIIGCPDFARLMAHRASKSKLEDWQKGKPAGSEFFNSPSFPEALVDAIIANDPAGMLLPDGTKAWEGSVGAVPSADSLVPALSEKRQLTAYLNRSLKNKSILCLSGGADKLVPYSCSKPLIDFLKGAVDGENGWWKGNGVYFEDQVFAEAGHETTPAMAKTAVDFIGKVLDGSISGNSTRTKL
jgi:hypothetical protein